MVVLGGVAFFNERGTPVRCVSEFGLALEPFRIFRAPALYSKSFRWTRCEVDGSIWGSAVLEDKCVSLLLFVTLKPRVE